MMKKIVNSSLAPEPIGPYSQAVIHGNTLYASGQIAIDRKSGELITGEIGKETELVMQNIEYILTEAGYSFSNVVKCTIFVKNMDDFAAINTVYGKRFNENPPARETVEVSRLPKNVNVEISCIAVK
ncbi:MAG TPA: RidA family protein [Fulvivirga sp.]|nr:RidA family protein [Fulvivirga sp.]